MILPSSLPSASVNTQTSSVALAIETSDSKASTVVFVNPLELKVVGSIKSARGYSPVIADFSGGFGASVKGKKRVAHVISGRKNLLWKAAPSAPAASIGRAGGIPLACSIDGDSEAEAVNATETGVTFMSSLTKGTYTIPIGSLGVLRDARCADMNNDGVDELVTLSTPVDQARGVRGKATLTIIPLDMQPTTTQVSQLTTSSAAQGVVLVDFDGDGSLDTCSYSRTTIACRSATGQTKSFRVGGTIQQVVVGSFSRAATGQLVDAFAVLKSGPKGLVLQVLGLDGTSRQVVSLADLLGPLNKTSSIRFVYCQ